MIPPVIRNGGWGAFLRLKSEIKISAVNWNYCENGVKRTGQFHT
jgi:hypothetical protein